MFLLIVAATCLGCDPLAGPVSGRLGFSSDTISFDTVFSGTGSATLELRAVNLENDPIIIDHIWLGGGAGSPFRLNIDGEACDGKKDVVIARGDSIFIFITVTIDPTGDDLPVAVTDSVSFRSGDFSGRIILEAWGQDIRLVTGDILTSTVWTGGKPYVIDGELFIDTLATLSISQGARVYMHHGAAVTVAGSLKAAGTPDRRILFATDRTEREYTDVPGRWKGITFLGCSHDNVLDYTVVRNAQTGVRIEGTAMSLPDLSMTGSVIMHNSVASVVADNAELSAVNSLFAHSGFSTVSLSGGGLYEFIHCTLSNRWEYSFRAEPALFISVGTGTMPVVSVINSVISGSLANEMEIDASAMVAASGFRADSSLIKVDTIAASWYSSPLFHDVITGLPPKFINEAEWDFRPDTLSPLVDRAGRSEMTALPFDIRNKPRPAFAGPDIGAFERQGGEKRQDNQAAGMAGMSDRN